MPSVLVTGAARGIGKAIVEHLASAGWDVIAGVRSEEDVTAITNVYPQRVSAVILDITNADHIARLPDALPKRLDALVNNAGVAVGGPVETVTPDDWRKSFEVNVIGQFAVTQAVLPCLRDSGGRVVFISSVNGRIATPMLGPYSASKFALEGVSDSLRRELRHLGVHVVLIEPGGVKTPIWKKGSSLADEMAADMPAEAEQLYGPMMEFLRAETVRIGERTGIDPSEVAEVIGTAMTATRPKTRYLVGRDAKSRWAIAKRIPDRAMDSLIARAMR
jgi:NAD(P)-dependent dehydrogenase (short-subunit alcohol dehydrogenase family)